MTGSRNRSVYVFAYWRQARNKINSASKQFCVLTFLVDKKKLVLSRSRLGQRYYSIPLWDTKIKKYKLKKYCCNNGIAVMHRHRIDLCACLCLCRTVFKYPLCESVHVPVCMSYCIRPCVSVSVCFALSVSPWLVHLVQQRLHKGQQ